MGCRRIRQALALLFAGVLSFALASSPALADDTEILAGSPIEDSLPAEEYGDPQEAVDPEEMPEASGDALGEEGEEAAGPSEEEPAEEEPATTEEGEPQESADEEGEEGELPASDPEEDSEPALEPASGQTLDGVDISGWNPGVDFTKLPGDFVIIKATEYNPNTRTYTSYNDYVSQATGALANGKLIGFYHFATAPSRGASIAAQADGFVAAVRNYIGQAVLVLDWEDTSYSTLQTRTDWAKEWLDSVYEQTGVKPMIYMSKSVARNSDWSAVKNAGYELWGAQYLYRYDSTHPDGKDTKYYVDDPVYNAYGDWGAWGAKPTIYQYSSTGKLEGTGTNPNIDVNKFYGTKDDWRKLAARQTGWFRQGDDWYYNKEGVVQKRTWVITQKGPGDAAYGMQRYWVQDDGRLAKDKLVKTGTNSWAYARPEGYVVRGRYTAGSGYVYLADNDGRLFDAGWIVSQAFGQGLQRYFIDSTARACVPGYSTQGYPHYTRPEGYVLRGKGHYEARDYIADNDGRITYRSKLADGWLVTNELGHGLQRYWVANDDVVRDKLVKTGANSWAYARPEGYVVRGRWTHPDSGNVYLADNNGKLENPGWLCSSAYGQGLQRYWIDSVEHACVPGYSASGWRHFTRAEGYVARGKYRDPSTGYVYLADNNGKLEADGWVCSSNYGDGLQRYYIEAATHSAVPGLSPSGWDHYTRPEGYVVRGRWTNPDNGYVYLADNNGMLEKAGWLCTDKYGQGLQRYWIDVTARACIPGLSNAGWKHYTRPEGYVVRGSYKALDGLTYTADNHGKITKIS